MKFIRRVLPPLLVCCLAVGAYLSQPLSSPDAPQAAEETLPAYSGSPWTEVGGSQPDFDTSQLDGSSFETYSPLDALGRCGAAYACVGRDLMPTEDRGAIGQVKPSGWQLAKYDCVDGKYLYNRCHLIGYQLTGENAEERNLITGTRYLNIQGMLPFENLVADYVQDTGNHVLYRVTPVFEVADLLARGVRMEGWSVEDNGAGVCFDVYCYNVQPGVVIDYADGSSREAEESAQTESDAAPWVPYLRRAAAFAREWLEDVKKAMEDHVIFHGFSVCRKRRKFKKISRFLMPYYHKTGEFSSLVSLCRRV